MQQCNEETCRQPMIVSITSSRDYRGTSIKGCGTGFFVRENLIATNIHCIAGATSVSVKLLDSNEEHDVEGVVAFDDKNDLVILKVSGIGTPFSIGNSDILKKGEVVKAVACIQGKCVKAEGEFLNSVNNGQWLRTTAKTDNGYSGGPLINSNKEVIGVNFVSRGNISEAVSSKILTELVAQTCTIELLEQWQERKAICAWSYIFQIKLKENERDDVNVRVCYDEAIQLNPDIIKFHYNRGAKKISLAQSQFEEGNVMEAEELRKSAIDDFTQAIGMCPDYTPAYNDRADAQLNLAKSESESGNVEKAHDLLQAALADVNIAIKENEYIPTEKDPDVAICYHTRGEIKEAIGDLSGAKDDLEDAMKNTEHTKNYEVSDDLKRVQDKLNQQE